MSCRPREVERAGQPDHLGGGDVELGDQQVEDVLVDRLLDLEPDRRAEPAPQQLLLQRREQVLGVVLLDLEVLVAGHPERVDARAPPCRGTAASGASAMTSSSGTNRWSPTGTNREKIGGTLTRAKCSLPVLGLRTSDREVERQPGDVGERVRRVDRQRRQHREDPLLEQLLAAASARRGRGRPSAAARCPRSASAGHDLVAEQRARAAPSARRGSLQICSSTSRGSSPVAAGTATPAAIRRLRPATRTMKNSSRLRAKIARNRTRSSSGSGRVLGELEHPRVEVQPGQLAVEEPVGGRGRGPSRRTAARRRTARRAPRAGRWARPGTGPPTWAARELPEEESTVMPSSWHPQVNEG